MSEINPYAPANIDSDRDSAEKGRNAVCPTCSTPILRWRFLSANTSVPCEGCGARLVLAIPWYFRLILFHTGLLLAAACWMLSEFTGFRIEPVLLIIPMAVMAMACWMQLTYGRVTVKGAKS